MPSERVAAPTLIFQHIYKTGGTTLSRIVARQFDDGAIYHIVEPRSKGPRFSRSAGTWSDFLDIPEADRGQYRCILGHMPFGLHHFLPGRCVYITMLRDPVQRVLSQYRQYVHHQLHAGEIDQGDIQPLRPYLDSHPRVLNNLQTRLLSGEHTRSTPDARSLEKARRHLLEHYRVPGILEQFDESLLLIADDLGWEDIRYVPQNVTRSYATDCDEETRERIREANELDQSLYDLARQRLHDEISRRGSAFQRGLTRFRTVNPGDAGSRAPHGKRNRQSANRRILIEASKLADLKMDGIKRYVVELIRGLRDSDALEGCKVDVLLGRQVHSLRRLPEDLLILQYPKVEQNSTSVPEPGTDDADPGGKSQRATPFSLRHRVLHAAGIWLPPILLPMIKALIPDTLSRAVLGKPRAELQAPGAQAGEKVNIRALDLYIPPVAFDLYHRLAPQRLLHLRWSRRHRDNLTRPIASGYDLVHLTLPNNFHKLGLAPGSGPVTGPSLLVTVHDLSHRMCPQLQNRVNNVTLDLGLKNSIEAGAHFLTVSEATRRDLVNVYGIEDERTSTVLSGCNERSFHPVEDDALRQSVRDKYRIAPGPYFLSLCTIEPRKNIITTIRGFDRLTESIDAPGLQLALAGAQGWKVRETMRLARQSAERICYLGFVDEEDLAALYSGAVAFIYASHYEGFGFPLLEAMHCGVPVIYGNNSSMPEIVGDAGLAVASDSETDLADAMQRLLRDPQFAAELGQRGRDRARAFSWDKAVSETVSIYQRTLSSLASEEPRE